MRPSSRPTARRPPLPSPSSAGGHQDAHVALVCGRPRQSRSPPPPPCKSSDRNEPSPHATDARNGSSGSIPTRYANPPRPMVLHLRSHAPTFHTDTLLSSDVVTAAPSLTQTLNTVLACALSGGPNLSTAIGALSKLASPTSSFTSRVHRSKSPPWLAVTRCTVRGAEVPCSDFSSPAFGPPTGFGSPTGGSRTVDHASDSHNLPRCASDRCGGHLGSDRVFLRLVRAPSHDHSVTARSRPPTARTILGSSLSDDPS